MPDTLPAAAGLCANCTHARAVPSARGSTFVLCARSQHDARFPKYPRLPVVRCAGYEAKLPTNEAPPTT
jgi:hypothetical protein